MPRIAHLPIPLALLIGCGLAGAAFADDQTARPPQLVLISFDGAHEIAQWERSRALASRTGAHFTYFLSCVFLLSPETKALYHPPRRKAGRSNVGFGKDKAEVAARLSQVWQARGEGHEIASHGCGHFDGKDWSAAEWRAELKQSRGILKDAFTINGIEGEPEGWRDFAESEITGFRAPYLSAGAGLLPALAAEGFRYDASGVERSSLEPTVRDGLVSFSLPMIPEGPSGRAIVAMDYNLFVRHSGGFERADTDGAFEERAYRAFRGAFDTAYAGKRPPLQLGFHFTLMNGGAYWRALERFAGEACMMPDVRCVTHGEAARVSAPPAPSSVPSPGG